MHNPPLSTPPEVGSLSARQVALLLQTLKQHHRLLDSSYEDAHRLDLSGVRPAYVVDFQLLWAFMFHAAPEPDGSAVDARPEADLELQYLFTHPESTYLIGPGTVMEIDRFLRLRGLNHAFRADGEFLLAGRARHMPAGDLRAIERLTHLCELPNVSLYTDLVPTSAVDDEAYLTLLAALGRLKRRASPEADQADALNLAAVIHMRGLVKSRHLPLFPYLLTSTRPLLEERTWSVDSSVPISRAPRDAIYTEILFDVFPDARTAANHTVQMAFESSVLERELRTCPANIDPAAFAFEPEWERVVAEGRLSSQLQVQLASLAGFVNDPVIYEAQRIFDNVRLSASSAMQQSGNRLPGSLDSPRKLFDLIRGIAKTLDLAPSGSVPLGKLWQTVLAVDRQPSERGARFVLRDRGGRYEYLTVDRLSAPGTPAPLFVFRWPSSLDADRVVHAFSEAYRRSQIKVVDLYVGIPDEVIECEAEVPIRLGEIVDVVKSRRARCPEEASADAVASSALAGSRDADQHASASGDDGVEISWLRMDSPVFDLYADTLSVPQRDPVIGLFVDSPDVTHTADFYSQTAARYLFHAWLIEALDSICGGAGPGVASDTTEDAAPAADDRGPWHELERRERAG